jgi:hypothetical protein
VEIIGSHILRVEKKILQNVDDKYREREGKIFAKAVQITTPDYRFCGGNSRKKTSELGVKLLIYTVHPKFQRTGL